MITYAGVDLPPLTDAVRDHLAKWWHQGRIAEFDPAGYYAPALAHLPHPTPPAPGPPRVGVLRWPTGASRWATYHHVVNGATLADIRDQSDGPHTLAVDDGTNSVSTSLFMLPPRPISQNDQDEDVYLLSLVDERWYWWQAGDEPNITFAPASWADLFSTLFSAAGASAAVDTVPGGYGTPTDRWVVSYQPVPVLLDAAARSVGARVVRHLDGTCFVRRWAGASADQKSQYAANSDEVLTGGTIDFTDVADAAPASCAVVFFGDEPAKSVQSLSALSLSEYGDATGVDGYAGQFNADVQASDTTHQTACAREAASDYYRWLLPSVDATFRGVVEWVPTGAEDVTEWEQCADAILTRVIRPPWADANVYAAPRPLDGRWGRVTGAGVSGSTSGSSHAGGPTAYSFRTVILDAGFNYVEAGGEIELAAYPLPDKTGYPPDVPTDGTVYAWFWRSKTQPGKWEFQYVCCCPPASSSSSSPSSSSPSSSSSSRSESQSESNSLSGSSSQSQSLSGSSSQSLSGSSSQSESESQSGSCSGCITYLADVSVACVGGVITTTKTFKTKCFVNGCWVDS